MPAFWENHNYIQSVRFVPPSPDAQPRQGDADDGDLPDFLRDLDADDIIKIE